MFNTQRLICKPHKLPFAISHGVSDYGGEMAAPKNQPHPESQEAVGERLRLVFLASGLSQKDWCKKVGISQQAWTNYEAGRRMISRTQASLVRKAARVTIDWIYHDSWDTLRTEVADALREAQAEAGPRIATRGRKPRAASLAVDE
jgi:transcriptional regulator with XRE-family HTH domain